MARRHTADIGRVGQMSHHRRIDRASMGTVRFDRIGAQDSAQMRFVGDRGRKAAWGFALGWMCRGP